MIFLFLKIKKINLCDDSAYSFDALDKNDCITHSKKGLNILEKIKLVSKN